MSMKIVLLAENYFTLKFGMVQFSKYLLAAACALMTFGSCSITHRLAEDEHLVVGNSLKIENADKTVNKLKLSYSLGGLYRQLPNKKTFGLIPTKVRTYYRYKDKKSRFGRWVLKTLAEPPVIYDDAESQRTALNFQNSMRQRGYLNATCNYSVAFDHKKAKVNYRLNVGKVYTIKSIDIVTQDTVLSTLLPRLKSQSLLGVGKPLAADIFNGEKARIADDLKNDGFAYFVQNNVDIVGDSSNHEVKVTVELLPPSDSTTHRRIYIDETTVFTNVITGNNEIRKDTVISGLYMVTNGQKFTVRPSVIADAIKLRPGSLFRQRDFDRTYRNLSNLGVYRLVSIKPTRDSSQTEKLDIAVSLSPNKRISTGFDLDANQLTSAQTARLFGTSANVYFRSRNFFRGAENFQSNLRYGVDLDVSKFRTNNTPIFSQEFRFINTVAIPRFLDYFGLWRNTHKIKVGDKYLLNTALYKRMQEDGIANLTLSGSSLEFFNQFKNRSVNAAFGYTLSGQKKNEEFRWNHIGLDILKVKTEPGFDAILAKNPFLRRSLGDQLFTGFILRDFTYRYFSQPNARKRTWNFRLAYEVSGAEIYAANKLWNIPYPGVTFKIKSLGFASYARLDSDFGYLRPLRGVSGLALAGHIGGSIVAPYGPTLNVPYVKQVFVGGSNSIRAWRVRELGPGAYRDTSLEAISQYYQTGDIRMEANLELRFDLVYFFKGVIFLDAGNIWTLRDDVGRDRSKISNQFYKEIAVGSGLGIRGDFDYFILRFDAGVKVRNPYADETGSYWAYKKLSQIRFNPNLAIAYPF